MKIPKHYWVFAFLVCWPSMLLADEALPRPYAAQLGSNRLTIYPDACQLGGWFAIWKKATWFYDGRNYEACWRVQRDQQGIAVKTVDAEGEVGSVPLSMFREVEGV